MKKLKKFYTRLVAEKKAISKPTKKEQWKGTWTTFVIAAVAALSVSAIDSVFTALIGLFF